jgi:mRNA-degrading endonuclease HigB of HigAB toxin-antitoxin module
LCQRPDRHFDVIARCVEFIDENGGRAGKTAADATAELADAREPVMAWYRQVKAADWATPAHVKRDIRSASILKDGRAVFNLAGNKYRIVCGSTTLIGSFTSDSSERTDSTTHGRASALSRFTRRRCALRHKFDIQRHRGWAGFRTATLFERAAYFERSLAKRRPWGFVTRVFAAHGRKRSLNRDAKPAAFCRFQNSIIDPWAAA